MNPAFIEQRKQTTKAIAQRYDVSEQMFDTVTGLLAPLATPVSLRKGDYLQRIGTPAKWVYWTYRGVVRNGFTNECGTEVTLRFTMDGEAAGSHEDLVGARSGVPAQHFVVAETAVEAYRMDWAEVRALAAEHQILRDYYLKVAEASILRQGRRISMHSHTSAAGRLAAFRREYPGLEERISQKVIASFLGITPQYMSQLLRTLLPPSAAAARSG